MCLCDADDLLKRPIVAGAIHAPSCQCDWCAAECDETSAEIKKSRGNVRAPLPRFDPSLGDE